MLSLFSFLVGIAYCIALIMTFSSTPLIRFLFGAEYIRSGVILSIHIWTSVFVFLGCAHNPYWLAENRQRFILVLSLIAMVMNIVFALVFIPMYQEIGAALATLLSFFFVNVVSLSFFKWTRPLFLITIKALIRPTIFPIRRSVA